MAARKIRSDTAKIFIATMFTKFNHIMFSSNWLKIGGIADASRLASTISPVSQARGRSFGVNNRRPDFILVA